MPRQIHVCTSCPKSCGVDRSQGPLGFCRTGEGLEIASICLHRGEEPALGGERGVCNVFFSHCNLQCVYCQNFQISRNDAPARSLPLEEVTSRIAALLDGGARSVGFVSPSHQIPQMRAIVDALRAAGRSPTFIMNTNSYDRVDTIRSLEGRIDVYLPDLRYANRDLALELSGAPDYPEIALAALREMYRQKGSNLALREDGAAASGLIIRHLILPGYIENSIACLRSIAEELSPSVHLSLMSQYYPTPAVARHPILGRTITRGEYDAVVEEMVRLGFTNGWVQELGSERSYRPDFEREHPFE